MFEYVCVSKDGYIFCGCEYLCVSVCECIGV